MMEVQSIKNKAEVAWGNNTGGGFYEI